ncbi:rRNA-processing protein UTP23 homolog [Lutzomyia longipalpis]|uniref:rRNA-processing protein UTP23 homolog n=1 Tax=Lutzomyia longipalpis TaxID=7200 RepID=UPI00248460E3|nr:rRNA-processing protein UTP23 homolog [Lutzomyia longipalpis]
MKVKRRNKLLKYLNYYKLNYGFRQPYQVLVDATFYNHACEKKVNIKDQITNYLNSEVKFLTTRCCIMEAESLKKKVQGLKEFALHQCTHTGERISGSKCFKSLAPESRYIIATQDKSLQSWCRRRPGQPVLYFHGVTPVFEAPSDATKKSVNDTLQKQLNDLGTLKVEPPKVFVKKKKKIKNPNPLSCPKKKRKPQQQMKKKNPDEPEKKKRKRIKIPQHVKEQLKDFKTTAKD